MLKISLFKQPAAAAAAFACYQLLDIFVQRLSEKWH